MTNFGQWLGRPFIQWPQHLKEAFLKEVAGPRGFIINDKGDLELVDPDKNVWEPKPSYQWHSSVNSEPRESLFSYGTRKYNGEPKFTWDLSSRR